VVAVGLCSQDHGLHSDMAFRFSAVVQVFFYIFNPCISSDVPDTARYERIPLVKEHFLSTPCEVLIAGSFRFHLPHHLYEYMYCVHTGIVQVLNDKAVNTALPPWVKAAVIK
jgi:hypothetical protein